MGTLPFLEYGPMLLLVALACTPPAPAPAPADTLVVVSDSQLGTMVSVVSETAFDQDISRALFFPLVETSFDCSLKKSPGLAERWEWSDNGQTLSMWLRDDITFSDGHPVTAADIAFTYDLAADPAVASPHVAYTSRLLPDGRPFIVDPYHIEWCFAEAYDRDTQVGHVSALSILPRHLLEDADRSALRTNGFATAPVGSGPFLLAEYVPGERTVLEPNPRFTGPEDHRAHLGRVEFRVVDDYADRLEALRTGSADYMAGLTVADADALRESNPELRLVRREAPDLDYVAWNLSNPLFSDVRVRTALAKAVDVDGLMSELLTSSAGPTYGRRAIGTITPALCGVHNDDIVPYPHDPEAARALLAEAGWTDSDGDGTLDRDGTPLAFTLITHSGNRRREQAAARIRDDLAAVGVAVTIHAEPSSELFPRLSRGDYEAALTGWSASLFVDPSVLWQCPEGEDRGFNVVGYCNPELDVLMDAGLRTTDPIAARATWQDVQARIYADQPYLFLYWMDELIAVHQRFDDASIDIQSPLGHLDRWRVAPEDVLRPVE